MSRFNNFKQKTENFIETGSYLGDGIQLAIDSGFKQIHSIELGVELYQHCVKRFENKPNVKLHQGDSTLILPQILQANPTTSFTFWLDGHYSGPHTARGEKDCPLIEELKNIMMRDIEGETIYVDDMRYYRNFDETLNHENMLAIVRQYKPQAIVTYEDTPYGKEDVMIIDY